MNKIALITLALLLSIGIKAQVLKHEFGLMGGAGYYLGDINHLQPFYKTGPDYGILYRRTLSDQWAVKAELSRVHLSADDKDFDSNYQQIRNHNFNTHLIELAALAEYNFLPYNPPERLTFAPYITFGAGFSIADNLQYKKLYPVIPMGAGVKFAVSKRLTINTSWVFRNSLSDLLDDLQENTPDANIAMINNKQQTSTSTNDWYSTAEVSLSFNFASTKKWCPAYSKNKK